MLLKKPFTLLLVGLVIFFATYYSTVFSAVSSCSVVVSPSSLTPSVTSSLTFTLNNTSSSNIVWAKFTAPSANFQTVSGSSSGWAFSTPSSTEVVFTGATLAIQAGQDFAVTVTTGGSEVSAAAWTVQTSDDAGGASPTTCTGTTEVAISGSPPDASSPTISDVSISDISDTSAKVNWTTNENANSLVEYGTTDSYGSSKSDSSYVTSHSLTLDSLSANTTYHFRITSADSSGNSESTQDLDFVTAKTGTTTTTTVTKTVTKTETKTTKDTSAPAVTIKTDFSKPYEKAPTIVGIASDSGGVSRIEYSIDNGKSFLPVDEIKSQFATSTTFEFTPAIIDDGDFKIKVRAIDATGNLAESKVYTLTIDRLPPLVGNTIFSVGPLVLEQKDGFVFSVANLSQKITLSSIGGATNIELVSGESKFDLVKNIESGLWTGTMNFDTPGVYKVNADSVDGANNTTTRQLSNVVVLSGGKVLSRDRVVKSARVTLYYFEPTLSQFVIWDAKPYGQTNPQKVRDDGSYELFVPAGKYYLEIKAPGYNKIKSEIFETSQSLPINVDFELRKAIGIKLGNFALTLPDFKRRVVPIKLNTPDVPDGLVAKSSAVGNEFSDFTLSGSDLKVTNIDLRSKPTIVTFLSSWSPFTYSQITHLDSIVDKENIKVMAIFPQESDSSISIFKKRGGYKTPLIADPDGTLIEPLNIQSIPTHVFIDRKGVVKKVKMGVLTGEELLDNLIS